MCGNKAIINYTDSGWREGETSPHWCGGLTTWRRGKLRPSWTQKQCAQVESLC